MRKFAFCKLLALLLISLPMNVLAQPLQMSDNKRCLVRADGTPFTGLYGRGGWENRESRRTSDHEMKSECKPAAIYFTLLI
jgi:hypothetical protein